MILLLYIVIAFISIHVIAAGIAWAQAPSWTKAKRRDSSGQQFYEIVGRIDRTEDSLWDSICRTMGQLSASTKRINNQEGNDYPILWLRMALSYCIILLHRTLLATRLSHDEMDKLFVGESSEVESVSKQELTSLLQRLDFAHWAYPFHKDYDKLEELLRQRGYLLIEHDKITKPGKVAHYIALNQKHKVMLIVPRGSCGLSDLITDAAGENVSQELPDAAEFDDRLAQIWSHEGCLAAANQLYRDTNELVERLVTQEGYRVELVGHSLGGAVAALMGCLFLTKLPILQDTSKLHIYAYAPPPCLNQEASQALEPYISTICWNDDIIPTLSVANYTFTCKILAHMDRQEKEYRGRFSLLTALAAALSTSLGFCGPMALSEERLDEMLEYAVDYMRTIHQEQQLEPTAPHHVHVPGKVLYLWERRHWNLPTGEINGVAAAGPNFIHLHLVIPTKDSLKNHFLDSYERGMRQLLEQMGDKKEHRRSIFLWEDISSAVQASLDESAANLQQ